MHHLNESALAWELFDAVRPGLRDGDVRPYVMGLSAGEYMSTIERLVQFAVDADRPMPPELVGGLQRWLDGYAGHSAQSRLCLLVEQLRTEVGSPRTSTPTRKPWPPAAATSGRRLTPTTRAVPGMAAIAPSSSNEPALDVHQNESRPGN